MPGSPPSPVRLRRSKCRTNSNSFWAMDEPKIPRYNHFLDKRRRWHAEEARNIEAFLQRGE